MEKIITALLFAIIVKCSIVNGQQIRCEAIRAMELNDNNAYELVEKYLPDIYYCLKLDSLDREINSLNTLLLEIDITKGMGNPLKSLGDLMDSIQANRNKDDYQESRIVRAFYHQYNDKVVNINEAEEIIPAISILVSKIYDPYDVMSFIFSNQCSGLTYSEALEKFKAFYTEIYSYNDNDSEDVEPAEQLPVPDNISSCTDLAKVVINASNCVEAIDKYMHLVYTCAELDSADRYVFKKKNLHMIAFAGMSNDQQTSTLDVVKNKVIEYRSAPDYEDIKSLALFTRDFMYKKINVQDKTATLNGLTKLAENVNRDPEKFINFVFSADCKGITYKEAFQKFLDQTKHEVKKIDR